MFSGWGVRTLSTDDRGYNPIGYHIGTIWPHDNAIVALDSRAPASARRRTGSSWLSWRRPPSPATVCRRRSQASERWVSRFPFRIPRPAPPGVGHRGPFVFVQAMLGLEAREGVFRLDPCVPEEIGGLSVRGLHAFGAEWDVEAVDADGGVRRAAATRF